MQTKANTPSITQ